ncbi:hypothetical protein, partial [methanotrophic endosymbiont of Bathymodiolus puteoserpentis (Logatchev)]|uniref:hypothetical protein n=1 Tax=methanotrophic endosymbiont of Bathymodiolus puteoserpentis (Logatchev) TaxID=343235 RepID=UPI001C2CF6C8
DSKGTVVRGKYACLQAIYGFSRIVMPEDKALFAFTSSCDRTIATDPPLMSTRMVESSPLPIFIIWVMGVKIWACRI